MAMHPTRPAPCGWPRDCSTDGKESYLLEMMTYEISPFLSLECQLGEGPLWHPDEACLYLVDIEGKAIWRVDIARKETKRFDLGQKIGCLGFRAQGGLIVAGEAGFSTWDPGTGELNPLSHPEADRPNARFNDGAVDPGGRFWAGTMTPEGYENNLYRIDPDLSVHRMETRIGIANGIDWSPDRKTMYFTDSARKMIYAYDFDVESGAIENRRIWVDSHEESGVPDGLCVDAEGCVWSARWDGWRVTHYDPQGRVIIEVPTPIQRPTSCTFGGPDLHTLYITSAWTDLSSEDRRNQPLAGDLFALDCDTPGLAPNRFLG
jgi:L-arabinonolactonase